MKKLLCLFLCFLMFVVLTACNSENKTDDTSTSNTNQSLETSTTESSNSNKTESLDVVLRDYIDIIVDKYNSQNTEKLVLTELFTPSDRESAHYRVEFRLNAFKDALGASYSLNDMIIDIIAYKTFLGDICCRIYTNDTTFTQTMNLIQGFSPILDEGLSSDVLNEAINELTDKKYANGYYFGELGLTLFGNDNSGYELMIKLE